MKRREFITLLGGAATWPVAARGQQAALPVVGYLYSGTAVDGAPNVAAFRKGLGEAGQVEGRDLAIETRWGENDRGRLPALAAELVRRRVALIVATPISSALPAKAATTTIPILFQTGSDPVRAGLVASFSRPGGNVTGVVFIAGALGAKRLDLLRQLVPNATTIGVLVNPNSPETEAERKDVQAAAQAIGQQLIILDVSSDRDIEIAFATSVQRGAGALLVGSGPFLTSKRENIVALAARYALPASYNLREFVDAGGPNELRDQHCRCLSPGRHLRRPDSQG
jgi:putative ABC transport system substrate-binding protein